MAWLRRISLGCLLLPMVACTTAGTDEDTGMPPVLPSTGSSPGSTTAPGGSTGSSGVGTTAAVDDTTTTATADSTNGMADGPIFDIGRIPDFRVPECLECGVTLASQQSGALDVFGANVFATAQLDGQQVYALGTYGGGRFIASADTALPFNEMSDCPLVSWLSGGNEMPTMMWFGWGPSDGPANWDVDGAVDAGMHLPPEYIGNPALLAADYEIVMYVEGSAQFDEGEEPTDEEMQTVLDYVQLHGGGLYVSSEFAAVAGGAYLNQDDLDSINRIMVPLGVESLPVNLSWGAAMGQIDFRCFPPPQG